MTRKCNRASIAARAFKVECEAALALFESFDTPRSLCCALLLKYQEYQQLVDLTIDVDNYFSVDAFRVDYLCTSLFSKSPRLPLEVDKAGVALSKWVEAEELCRQTNERIRVFSRDGHVAQLEDRLFVRDVQREIQRILGPSPTARDLRFCEESMRFGPGATVSCKGVVTNGRKYMNRPIATTPSLVHFRAFCFPESWKKNVNDLLVVNGSDLTTVPKNAKTDRVICIEPDLNIFVQLGIGALIRKKLQQTGLDLQDQTVNQTWAQLAHELDLATVDLSAASDTIAYELVHLLLPPCWVELLEWARSPFTNVNGKAVELEKWSSMGNGYTFELESLIFLAISRVASRRSGCSDVCVSVYGDDIIVPADALPYLTRALDFLGFRVNSGKSFGKGVFHESCGADFYLGHNVRPFFLRTESEDFDSICYINANNASTWAMLPYGGNVRDSRVLPFWLRCYSAVDPKRRYHIPQGYDKAGGFYSSFERAAPQVWRCDSHTFRGWRFDYHRIPSVERVVDLEGSYIASLRSPSDFAQGREALRGRFRQPRKARGYVLHWPLLGPWV